jgi:hypothetical protein
MRAMSQRCVMDVNPHNLHMTTVRVGGSAPDLPALPYPTRYDRKVIRTPRRAPRDATLRNRDGAFLAATNSER